MTEPSKEPLGFIEPYGDKIYITIEDKATKIGLVEIPMDAHMRSQIGIVRAMGKDVEEEGIFKVGDRVLINFGAGKHIQLPETYSFEPFHRIICDHEILSKVKKNGESSEDNG